jgi:hypothetical protein
MKNRFFSTRNLFMAATLFALGLVFSSCLKSKDTTMTSNPAAGLMAFNLSPDKTSVGITLSGNAFAGGMPLSYSSFTGSYLPVYPGERSIASYDNVAATSIATSTQTFEQDKYYSLFVVGANGNYNNLVTTDNFEPLSASSGKAYIRYINAIPDSSKPAVTVSAGGTNLLSGDAAYKHVSEFVEVNPGQVTITATNGATINVNRTITVEQKKAYTVLIYGVAGGTGDNAVQIKYVENGTLTD